MYFYGKLRLLILTSIDENGLMCQALAWELIFTDDVKHQKPSDMEYEGLLNKIRHSQIGKNGRSVSRVHAFKHNVLEIT